MNSFSLAIGLVFLATTSATAAEVRVHHPLLAVEDGDTLLVEADGKPLRLQLVGIDAPEDVVNAKLNHDQQRTGMESTQLLLLGELATKHLRSLIVIGAAVSVEGDLNKMDRYGRIPVLAFTASGESLNSAMVADGFAVTLSRPPLPQQFSHLKEQLQQLQQNAITTKRGLWRSHPDASRRWSGLSDR